MNSIEITDELFYQIMPIAGKILIGRLPADQELEHVFSKRFGRKMRKLIRQQKRR